MIVGLIVLGLFVIVLTVVFFKLRRTLAILEERISETQQVVINHNKILIQLTAFYKELQDRIIHSTATKNTDSKYYS